MKGNGKPDNGATKKRIYILVYGCYLLYSLAMVAASFAGLHPLSSINAIALYFLAFVLLGIFALIWQQVLKYMPLTAAYANRAVTIIYGMIFGAVLFGEEISWTMLLGASIIICGIVLMVKNYE